MKLKPVSLAICGLLIATLACNISTPQGPPASEPEIVTIIATATTLGPLEAPTESAPVEQSPTIPVSENENSTSADSGETGTTTSADGNIFSSVSIKNGDTSIDGHVAYPGINASVEIFVKPIGFDNVKTSGNLIFTMTCSGQGKAKVNYKGGIIKSGSPGCGETWTIYVINGSPDSQITIHLDANGDINWTLSVTSGG